MTPFSLIHEIKTEIDSFFHRDPALRSRWEVVLCYPGFHALILHRLIHKLWQTPFAPIRLLARFLSAGNRFLTGIEIHPGARIGKRVFIDHGAGIVIGETTEIYDDCMLYQGVTLGGTNWGGGKRHPTLKRNVVIGAGAKVLGPIVLGEGVRIGSNAVVVKDVPDGATAVGVPAKILETHQHDQSQFDAYGIVSRADDPMAKAFQDILNQLKQQQDTIENLKAEINRLR